MEWRAAGRKRKSHPSPDERSAIRENKVSLTDRKSNEAEGIEVDTRLGKEVSSPFTISSETANIGGTENGDGDEIS